MKEPEKVLKDIAEQLSYCDTLVSSEVRLDFAILMLEELQEELQKLEENMENKEQIKALIDKAKILYHRAKTLLSLQESRSMNRQFED